MNLLPQYHMSLFPGPIYFLEDNVPVSPTQDPSRYGHRLGMGTLNHGLWT
jgi:hypothetical protein